MEPSTIVMPIDPRYELRKDWAFRRKAFRRVWSLFGPCGRVLEVLASEYLDVAVMAAEDYIRAARVAG